MIGNPDIGCKRAEINPGTEEENTDGELLFLVRFVLFCKKYISHLHDTTESPDDVLCLRFAADTVTHDFAPVKRDKFFIISSFFVA